MGLIGHIARTAVVAGTATAVSHRVSRRQARRWAQDDQAAYAQQQVAQPQYAAPPQYVEAAPAAAVTPDPIEQLTQLAELKDRGMLTEAEFDAQKVKILAS